MSLKCYLAIPGKEKMHRGLLSGEPESDPGALTWKAAVCRIPFAGRSLTVCKGHIDPFGRTPCNAPVKDTMLHCQSPWCKGTHKRRTIGNVIMMILGKVQVCPMCSCKNELKNVRKKNSCSKYICVFCGVSRHLETTSGASVLNNTVFELQTHQRQYLKSARMLQTLYTQGTSCLS